jgi:hypothetical protein
MGQSDFTETRKTKKWYDLLPPDDWFVLTPSFWALIAGAVFSIAVNFLTTVTTQSVSPGVRASTILFAISGIGFARVSLLLEDSRGKIKLENLRYEIKERKRTLSLWFIIGVLSLLFGLLFLLW